MKISSEQLARLALLEAIVRWGQGTICVFREHEGKPAVLRLDQQNTFREWGGCFSLVEL